MSKRSDLLYLGHMLDTARSAYSKISAVTRPEFDRDENLQLAVTHLLQIIGEAARRVPEVARAKYPDIPWSQIIGMRHKLVHDYFEISLDDVWRTANEDLMPLIATLEKHTPPEPPP